jgi:hypothetical protein
MVFAQMPVVRSEADVSMLRQRRCSVSACAHGNVYADPSNHAHGKRQRTGYRAASARGLRWPAWLRTDWLAERKRTRLQSARRSAAESKSQGSTALLLLRQASAAC